MVTIRSAEAGVGAAANFRSVPLCGDLGQALLLARQIVEQVAEHRGAASRWSEPKPEITEQMDDLLGMLLGLSDDEPTPAEVAAALTKEFSGVFSAERYKGLPLSVAPVAVMREMLAEHRIAFNSRACGNFDEFVRRFGNAILRAR